MSGLTPESISPSFVEHILHEREKKRPADQLDMTTHPYPFAADWCVDGFHTQNQKPGGPKPAASGLIVAGAGVRRVFSNDIGLETPYEFMQNTVFAANGHPVEFIYNTHHHCGEIFVSEGAITPEEQAAVTSAAWATWQAAADLLKVLSPADSKRVVVHWLKGKRGSAPTIRQTPSGLQIANPDYLQTIAKTHPLHPDLASQLPRQQQIIYQQTVNTT